MSAAPIWPLRRPTDPISVSRMLRSSRRRAARSSAVAPTPNSWSKTVRGSRIIGSGVVGVAPADRVGVDARVAVFAAAGLVDRLDAQLHRRDRRVLAEALGVELIDGDAGLHVRAHRLLGMGLGEEHRAGAEVIAADLRGGEGLGLAQVGVADDGDVLAHRLERSQDARREVEARARWRPATTGCSSSRRRCCRRRRAPSRCRPAAPCRRRRSWHGPSRPAPSPPAAAGRR